MKYIVALVALFLASCTHKPEESVRKSVVFIHGSHFDSGAWSQVLPELQDLYDTHTITLMGRDEVEHASLTEMAKDACEQVQTPSVMVGHSFGGAVINQMMGICPEKVQGIVYVTALVPLKGEKPFDAMGKADQAAYEKAVTFKKDRIVPKATATFLKAMDADVIVKPLPDVRLYSESYIGGADPIIYEDAAFAQVPKYYIYATHDQIVQMTSQKKYTDRTKMRKTESVESGHLPMLSKPKELAGALKKVIN
ncbi:Pyrethroid hydrolase [compost metagenome]